LFMFAIVRPVAYTVIHGSFNARECIGVPGPSV
jgi:hypothetical protein